MGLGDEWMFLAEAQKQHIKTKKKIRPQKNGCDYFHPLFKIVDFLSYDESSLILDVFPNNGNRPYIKSDTPKKFIWKKFKPNRLKVSLDRSILAIADNLLSELGIKDNNFCIINPDAKNLATPNKSWKKTFFEDLSYKLSKKLPVLRINFNHFRKIKYAYDVNINSYELTIALISKARFIVTTEGFINHIAASTKTKAFVICNGYISPKVVGYDDQTYFFQSHGNHDLGCGLKIKCAHCQNIQNNLLPIHLYNAIKNEGFLSNVPLLGNFNPNHGHGMQNKNVLIIVPQMHLPWKKSKNQTIIESKSADFLRSQWFSFASLLKLYFDSKKFNVELRVLNFCDIKPENIYSLKFNYYFIPHHTKSNWDIRLNNLFFYMQEYLPSTFVIDKSGWSADASDYPLELDNSKSQNFDNYNYYKKLYFGHSYVDKFLQPDRQAQKFNFKTFLSFDKLPNKFIFFPLQIPHDEALQFFYGEEEFKLVLNLAKWCEINHIYLVLKPHPANINIFNPLKEEIHGFRYTIWTNNYNVFDLIKRSYAVYTINSGVGFEALFHNKVVVTFGCVDYDPVTIKGSNDYDLCWDNVVKSQSYRASKKRQERTMTFLELFFSKKLYDVNYKNKTLKKFDNFFKLK